MIKASIIGISGYGGVELYKILKKHPDVEIVSIYSESYKNKKIGEVYPHLYNYNDVCSSLNAEQIVEISDIIFTAVPHGGASLAYVLQCKKQNKKIIDLSADFRLKDINIYKEWYEHTPKFPELIHDFQYGLPELYKEQIKKSNFIANPGCYTTASILSNAPLLKENIIEKNSIIIDAKSGVSGAGRKPDQKYHFPELNESLQAYSVPRHRHIPEIEQELSNIANEKIVVTFTPHLIPMIRGILTVSYSNMRTNINLSQIIELYKEFYKNAPFVRILQDILPNTKNVSGTNFIDIAIKIDERTNRIIVISAIDNLVKGAGGQAVQNMNLMFGLDETAGLDFISLFP